MSGNSIGTGSYSSTPDWGESKKRTEEKLNEGLETSRNLRVAGNEAGEKRNETLWAIYNLRNKMTGWNNLHNI